MGLIFLEFSDERYGRNRVFDDIDRALGDISEEISSWSNYLSKIRKFDNYTEDQSAFETPQEAWLEAQAICRRYRRTGMPQNDEILSHRGLAEFNSPVGYSLRWMIEFVGPRAGHFAALSCGMGEQFIPYDDQEASTGILLFDRTLANQTLNEIETFSQPQLRKVENLALEVESISKSVTRFLDDVEGLNKLIKRQSDDVITFKAESDIEIRKALANSNTLITDHVSRIEKLAKDHELDLTAKTKSFDDGITAWMKAKEEERQLTKPAILWSNRAKKHVRTSSLLQGVLGATAVLGLMLTAAIVYLSLQFSEFLISDIVESPNSIYALISPLTLLSYRLAITLALCLAWLIVFFWAMRVIVRLYTIEHHLAIDASARGAMNETYLGLIEAGAINEADRAIVLTALFQPVQDGIVKDDGPPAIAPAALFSGILNSKS